MPVLPTGTITFLFTDIEGSTRLWQQEPSIMPAALERHNTLLRTAIEESGGVVFKMVGDAFCAAFSRAVNALAAAEAAQRALLTEPWVQTCVIAVRMAVHAGTAEVQAGEYVGHALNRVARLLSVAHGGQILVSGAVEELAAGQLPREVTLLDLGEHRLKDLVRPEHIYQLSAPGLPTRFPPLATLDARSTNLPTQSTEFVGREQEVATVAEMVRRPDLRLLTLTGPGGTGKTRLALQVGAEVLDSFADGVYFVELGEAVDATHMAYAIAQALHIKEVAGPDPLEILTSFLCAREILLILDNFEQLVDAAPAVSRLLAAAPDLTTLVTSRVVLHLSGEHEHAVSGLSQPDPQHLPPRERLLQYDAVALFVERARSIKPDFAVTDENATAIAEICRRLDGLPLALELAAARIRLFSPGAILSRLERRLALLTGGPRDAPVRQQTLRGAIDWSYSLLTPQEQRIFARLSVFVGGCTLESAEAVCAADGELAIDLLDVVSSLVEKSLLRRTESDLLDESRFIMLETIREYASDKLTESGEADTIRARHFSFFADLASAGYKSVWGETDGSVSPDRLVPDNDNLIAALNWAIGRRDVPGALRVAGHLCWLWLIRGRWHDARTWTDAAFSMARGGFPAERGMLLWGSGVLSAMMGDSGTGIKCIMEGQRLLEEAGDLESSTRALIFGGMFMSTSGETESGIECLERGLATARKRSDSWAVGTALTALAHAAMTDEDYGRARRYAEESVAWFPATSPTFWWAHVANIRGDLSRLEGAYTEASEHYMRALAATAESGFHAMVPSMRHNLAWTSHDLGDDTRAIELFTVSLREFQHMGDERGIAECLVGIGCTVDRPEIAARCFAAGFSILQKLNLTLSRPNQRDYDRGALRIRDVLGEEGWEAAWAEGTKLTPDEVLIMASAD